MFLNLHLGFFLFCTEHRTKTTKPKLDKILGFYSLATVLTIASWLFFSTHLSVYIPLLIGFLCFLKTKLLNSESDFKKLNSIIIMCEMTLIYLKTGRSFDESVRLSSSKIGGYFLKFTQDKKNVVVQQPKSRKVRLFEDFEQDLNQVAKVQVGKLELLESVKTKYDTFLSLKQKTQTATTQYRAQSSTLVALWLLSLTSLIWQDKFFVHQNTIVVSLVMMVLGLILSRRILIKTEFRI